MIIAIDGPAGSGKSSTAKAVARRLGFIHLDTGAMYRAITLKCLRQGVAHTDDGALSAVLNATQLRFIGSPPETRILMDGEDVSEEIRNERVTAAVSDFCAPAVVRSALVQQQREIGASASCVCEGRDIGTVVFPQAELKFFMVASVEERARRRKLDFARMGVEKSVEELVADIRSRDTKDSTRANSPLLQAEGATMLDTTDLSFEQQVEHIVEQAQKLQNK